MAHHLFPAATQATSSPSIFQLQQRISPEEPQPLPKSHPSKPGRSRVRHLQPFQAVLLLPSTRHFWDASDSLAHLRRAVRVFSGFCSVAALTRCSRFFLYINKCVLVYFAVCEDARPVCCQSQLDRRGTFCHVKSSDEVELRGEMATVDSVEQLFCVRG